MGNNTEDQKEEPFIYLKTSEIAVRGARSGSIFLNEAKCYSAGRGSGSELVNAAREELRNCSLSVDKSNLKTPEIYFHGALKAVKMFNNAKENLRNWVLSGQISNLKGQSIDSIIMDDYSEEDEQQIGNSL